MQIIDFKLNPSALEVDNFDLVDMQTGINAEHNHQKKVQKLSTNKILLDAELQYRITSKNFEKYFGIDILKYVKNYKFDYRTRKKLDSALKGMNSSIVKDTSIVIYVRCNNISYDIEKK